MKQKTYTIILAVIITMCMIQIINVQAQTNHEALIMTTLINQDPDPAYAGDTVEIRIGVENRGGVAEENIILEATPEYPFTLVPGQDSIIPIGTMDAYQYGDNMKIIKIKIKVDQNANAGLYDLKIKQYKDGQATTYAEKSVAINVKSKVNAEVIHIDKTTLVPGKQTSLKFVINNVGNSPLKDMVFYWENSDNVILPVGSDNTRYIKYVDIGKSAEVEYEVVADSNANAGLYKLNLHLTYDDGSSSTATVSTIAGVYVGGGTNFDIAFSETASGSTSFTIANVGSNPATSVSVSIPDQTGWKVSGAKSMIIGNLNTGDYTVASFTLSSSQQMMPGGIDQNGQRRNTSSQQQLTQRATSNSIKLQVDYTDTMGSRQTLEKDVAVNQQPSGNSTFSGGGYGRRTTQKSFLSTYKWYIIGIIILILAFIVHRRYGKKKTQNANYHLKNVFNRKEDHTDKKK